MGKSTFDQRGNSGSWDQCYFFDRLEGNFSSKHASVVCTLSPGQTLTFCCFWCNHDNTSVAMPLCYPGIWKEYWETGKFHFSFKNRNGSTCSINEESFGSGTKQVETRGWFYLNLSRLWRPYYHRYTKGRMPIVFRSVRDYHLSDFQLTDFQGHLHLVVLFDLNDHYFPNDSYEAWACWKKNSAGPCLLKKPHIVQQDIFCFIFVL